jgi:hypothetical protein
MQPSRPPSSSAPLALGPSQAVLVPDDATRELLLRTAAFAGAGERIFTVASAKGREWNDVLLLNFFEGSARALGPDAKSWRALLNLLESGAAARRGLDVGAAGVAFGFTGKSAERAGVSAADPSLRAQPLANFVEWAAKPPAAFETAAKSLYVALTRARARLWIWEGPIPTPAASSSGSGAAQQPTYLGAAAAPFAFLQRCYLVTAVHAKAGADAVAPFVLGG